MKFYRLERKNQRRLDLQDSQEKLKVFYDGGCVLCSKEIDIYQRKDTSSKIDFIDIDSESFDAESFGLDPSEVHEKFHVMTPTGEVVVGVPGFAEIWATLGIFKPLQFLSASKLGGMAMNVGYNVFVKARPFLPRKEKCETDACYR